MPNGREHKLEDLFGEKEVKVRTETGEIMSLGLKEDNTLWLEGYHIANFDPSTGVITPSAQVGRRQRVQATLGIYKPPKELAMPIVEGALGKLVLARETDEEKLEKLTTYGGVDEAEAQRITDLSKLSLSAEGWIGKYKEINPSFSKDVLSSLTMRSVSAGFGDLVTGAAGVAGWAGLDNINKNLTEVARSFHSVAPPQENWDVSLGTVLDPRFWSTVIARALPFSVSMIPITLLTFGIGTVAIGAIGLGAWTTHILASIFGGVSGAILESAFEAGGVWNEAKAKGFTDDEASKAARSTLIKGIGALTGTNALELFAAFIPDPTRILNRLVGRGLVTITRVGGKITFVGLTEAGEEAIQDVISRTALGEEVKLDDDMKMQMFVGFLMGAGMGGGADVLTTISNRTVNKLGDEHFLRWETEFDRLKAEGATDEQATIAALDTIADEEVNKITDEVIKGTIKEEALKSLKPKSAAEEIAVSHDLDKARSEAAITPAPEAAQRKTLAEIDATPEIHKLYPEFDKIYTRRNTLVDRLAQLEAEAKGRPKFEKRLDRLAEQRDAADADLVAIQQRVAREHPELAYREAKPAAVEVDVKTKPALTKRIQQLIDKKGFLTKKGLPNAEIQKIYKEFRPRGGLKGMTKTQLRGVLQRINESRPKRIEGRTVITEETERHIVALRSTLMRANVLSDLGYSRIGNMLGFTTDRYVDKEQFLTEKEGKKLIREVNRQAELGLMEWDARVVEGLKTQPAVAKALEEIDRRIEKPLKKMQWIKLPKLPALGDFWDMTRYYQELQRATERAGGRFYDVFSVLVKQANINDYLILGLDKTLKEACPNVNALARDDKASERVAAQLRDESPPDITEDELRAADYIRKEYDSVKNMIRYHRVRWGIDFREGNAELIAKDIKGAPLDEIKEAVRQWETGGETAMAKYLADKDWGIIQSGYDPRQVANPKVQLADIRHIRVSKTELYGRKVEEMPADQKNVFMRRRSYWRRLFALELEPYFKEMERMVDEVKPFLKNPESVANGITRNIKEFRGYYPEHLFTRMAMKTGGYAFSVLALSPHMSIRNMHQNIVLHPDVVSAFHPGNKVPSAAQQQFTDVHVQQDIAIRREWLMQEALGRSPMSRLVRWITYYHKSDRVNRAVSMWLSTNKARRALETSQRSGKLADYLSGSGFYDLQPLEQRYILQLKALPEVDFGAEIPIVSGDEAAIWEQARLRTEKSHFRYKRRERALVEQGEVGRIFGSLMTFPRGYAQNLYDYFQKLDPRIDVPLAERGRIAKDLIMLAAGTVAANALYGLTTGKGREPYDPTEVLSWSFGGLAVGAVQTITDLWGDTLRAMMGDEGALGRVIRGFPRVAEMFLPIYKQAIDITEAIIGRRYIDRYALRKIKEAFDETYEVREDYYEAPRTIIQMAQHIFFGTTYAEQIEGAEEEAEKAIPEVAPEIKEHKLKDLFK